MTFTLTSGRHQVFSPPRLLVEQSGVVEACWAHNPAVRRSKLLRSATNFYLDKPADRPVLAAYSHAMSDSVSDCSENDANAPDPLDHLSMIFSDEKLSQTLLRGFLYGSKATPKSSGLCHSPVCQPQE